MLGFSKHCLSAAVLLSAALALPLKADVMRPFSVWLAKEADLKVPVTAPIYVPELSRALRMTPVQASDAFTVRITKGQVANSIPHRSLNRAAELPKFDGSTRAIPAIHLTKGRTSLRALARAPEVQDHLSCDGPHCKLSAPLLIAEGATLTLDGVRLDLEQAGAALISNHGSLTIRNSHLEAILPADFTFDEKYRSFRPFVMGEEGSDTRLIGSSFVNLGYNGSSSYGVSIAARKGERAPTGMLVGNTFEGLYYGFYSHHAKNISIIDNLYRDNIVYGIDPHDYSYNLWIIGNRTHGTQKKHGIIISRGVHNTVIAMNRSYDNAAAGIMLDRHSSDNVVIHNHTQNNGNDGIAIYESSDNLIAYNTGLSNGKTGLRIRNSRGLIVAHNYFASNVTGIKAYTGRPSGFARRDEDIYTKETQARLISNTVTGNTREDMSVKGCISRMIFFEEPGNQPGFTTEKVTFGGDKHWRDMLRALASRTRGSLDIRYECEAIEVRPAEERSDKNSG